MLDAMEARLWAEHGRAFSQAAARLSAATWVAFKALNRIEFAAPWRERMETPAPIGQARGSDRRFAGASRKSGGITTIRTKLKLAVLALAAALAVDAAGLTAVASPAHAETPSVRVRYNDLNLHTQGGVERLEARVRAAADELCLTPGVRPLSLRLKDLACRDALLAAAAQDVRQVLARSNGSPASPSVAAGSR